MYHKAYGRTHNQDNNRRDANPCGLFVPTRQTTRQIKNQFRELGGFLRCENAPFHEILPIKKGRE